MLVAITTAGSDYLRTLRHANRAEFVQLIKELPADEAAALTAAIPALEHLHQLYNHEKEVAGTRISKGVVATPAARAL